jgi:hypothetical protein
MADGQSGREIEVASERDKADPWMATLVGWYETEADRQEAQQESHDALIRMLGADRRGGVGWHHLTGLEALSFLSSLLTEESSRRLRSHYVKLAELLTDRGGWLVVATAEAARGSEYGTGGIHDDQKGA